MNEKLNEVLDSKIFVKDGSAIAYPSPRKLIEPFVEVLGDGFDESKMRVATTGKVVNQNADETQNVSFPRVLCEYDLSNNVVVEEVNETFENVLGFIYALDTKKPVLKTYSGYNASACLNLCIFGADKLFQQELLGNYQDIYRKAEVFMNKELEEAAEFEKVIRNLATASINRFEVDHAIGKLLRLGLKNNIFGTDHVLKAAKLLNDPNSAYAIKDGKTTKWNLYNTLTQTISDSKNIAARPDKTVALTKMLGVN